MIIHNNKKVIKIQDIIISGICIDDWWMLHISLGILLQHIISYN